MSEGRLAARGKGNGHRLRGTGPLTTYRICRWDPVFENHKTRDKPKMVMQRLQVPIDFSGTGYTELLDHTRGPAHYACWIVTGGVAAQCQPRGTLVRKDGKPHDPGTVARITRIPKRVMSEAWNRFISMGWLEPCEEKGDHGRGRAPERPSDGMGSGMGSPLNPPAKKRRKRSPRKTPTRAEGTRGGLSTSGDGGRRNPEETLVQGFKTPPTCTVCTPSGDLAGAVLRPDGSIAKCCSCKLGQDRAFRLTADQIRRRHDKDGKRRRSSGAQSLGQIMTRAQRESDS